MECSGNRFGQSDHQVCGVRCSLVIGLDKLKGLSAHPLDCCFTAIRSKPGTAAAGICNCTLCNLDGTRFNNVSLKGHCTSTCMLHSDPGCIFVLALRCIVNSTVVVSEYAFDGHHTEQPMGCRAEFPTRRF